MDNTNSDFWEISTPSGSTSFPVSTNASAFVGWATVDAAGRLANHQNRPRPVNSIRCCYFVSHHSGWQRAPPGQLLSVRDPPAAGVKKPGVSCAPLGRLPSAVCILSPPAVDTTLVTPTSDVAINVNAFTASITIGTSALSSCLSNTNEDVTHLISNGDFSSALPFASEAAIDPVNSYNVANSASHQAGV